LGKKTELFVRKTARRLKNKPPRLMTSDDYKPYKEAILKAFGKGGKGISGHYKPPWKGKKGKTVSRRCLYVSKNDL